MFTLFNRLILLLTSVTTPLMAGGWGSDGESEYALGVQWDSVSCNVAGISYKAMIPGYTCGSWRNGEILLQGSAGANAKYIISSSIGQKELPRQLTQFIEVIACSNPDFIVTPVSNKPEKTICCVDLTPKKGQGAFFRFFYVNRRLIQMGTTDANDKRRMKFFESIQF